MIPGFEVVFTRWLFAQIYGTQNPKPAFNNIVPRPVIGLKPENLGIIRPGALDQNPSEPLLSAEEASRHQQLYWPDYAEPRNLLLFVTASSLCMPSPGHLGAADDRQRRDDGSLTGDQQLTLDLTVVDLEYLRCDLHYENELITVSAATFFVDRLQHILALTNARNQGSQEEVGDQRYRFRYPSFEPMIDKGDDGRSGATAEAEPRITHDIVTQDLCWQLTQVGPLSRTFAIFEDAGARDDPPQQKTAQLFSQCLTIDLQTAVSAPEAMVTVDAPREEREGQRLAFELPNNLVVSSDRQARAEGLIEAALKAAATSVENDDTPEDDYRWLAKLVKPQTPLNTGVEPDADTSVLHQGYILADAAYHPALDLNMAACSINVSLAEVVEGLSGIDKQARALVDYLLHLSETDALPAGRFVWDVDVVGEGQGERELWHTRSNPQRDNLAFFYVPSEAEYWAQETDRVWDGQVAASVVIYLSQHYKEQSEALKTIRFKDVLTFLVERKWL